ncbi:hypothetical protein RHGRI_021491 [Rhododendron griersonianum]|uniref:Uncharacterized protein n=1 Tax=Rhododendron griersonianum TaxID=479676 RepID=A0AAV6JKP9_9ERIC|nr:hypothetical protein RHGRI_021491 [Rhododendron griersonianum]
MVIFREPGQHPYARFLSREEQEKRRRKHQRRVARLGEKRAKKKLKEDDEQVERLIKLMVEAAAKIAPPKGQQMSKLTETELLEYRKTVSESRGFDVGDIPHDKCYMVSVTPIPLARRLELMGGYSKLALDEHNEKNSTNYQFVKVSRHYNITFQVKDMARSGSPTLNFQAIVKTFKGQATILFSAPEP